MTITQHIQYVGQMQPQTIEHEPIRKPRKAQDGRRRNKPPKPPKGVIPPALVPTLFKPGHSGNPNGFTGLHGEIMRMARTASPMAVAKLVELVGSPDDRVALMAADKLLERAWGKPKEVQDDKTAGPPDLGALSAADLAELRRIAGKMRGGQDSPVAAPEAPPSEVEAIEVPDLPAEG